MELTIETPTRKLEKSFSRRLNTKPAYGLPSAIKLAFACLLASALGAALVITAENAFKVEEIAFVPKPKRIIQSSPQLTQTTGEKSNQINLASNHQALYLVRTTLLALHQANQTGNYSVLRALGTPQFSARNASADLAIIFSNLRRKKINLAEVALITPRWQAPPNFTKNDLTLRGFLPLSTGEVYFDMQFKAVSGQWKIFALSVSTPPSNTSKPTVRAKRQKQQPSSNTSHNEENSNPRDARAATQNAKQNRG